MCIRDRYNSVWRFASFHELIKITVATVITGVLHIVGITIFWERMPASYYLIGIMPVSYTHLLYIDPEPELLKEYEIRHAADKDCLLYTSRCV